MSAARLQAESRYASGRASPARQAGRLALGAAQLAGTAVSVSLGTTTWAAGRALDVAVGTGVVAGEGMAWAARRAARALRPIAVLVLYPPLVPTSRQPAVVLDALARRGRIEVVLAREDIDRALSILVPRVVELAMERVALTDVVKRHLDLNALVAEVDLDAVASRLDVDAVIRRVDFDAVLDRLDLTVLIRERVDLDEVVAGVDLDAVAGRLDVDAVARRLDIDAVIDRIDLAALAEQVINAIDLPEIIRQATGSVTSEAVRGARMQSIQADEAVARILGRLLLRRRARPTTGAGGPPSVAGEPPMPS